MRYQAVIGANFGDEGKGRTVDWLVSKAAEPPLVVRYNSGSQAGHTVKIDDKRHVFSHFGSGTLRGASTILCGEFHSDPSAFLEEYEALENLGRRPYVYIDPNVRLITPLDVALNRIREISRGASRHGSCGAGFGAAVERYNDGAPLTIGLYMSCLDLDELSERLKNHFWWRLQTENLLGIEDDEYQSFITSVMKGEFIWSRYWGRVDKMLDRAIVGRLESHFRGADHVIFESAQGLMLHEDHEYAPHVTWCRTGIEDLPGLMHRISPGSSDQSLQAFYCSRAYLTRHGAGPLPGEEPMPDWVVDPTNAPNDWQGTLRYAPFNIALTEGEVMQDIYRAIYKIKVDPVRVLSCADQLPSLDSAMTEWADVVGWSPDSSETEVM